MKNHLFPILISISIAVFFNSCSSSNDDTNLEPEKKLLLSKFTTTYYDNPSQPETIEQTFEYNSKGELIKSLHKGLVTTFEYFNGKPTKATFFNNKQEPSYSSVFYYNQGGQLDKIKATYANSSSRTTNYTYNSNDQLINITNCFSENCNNPGTISYTYDGENISTEITSTPGTVSSTYKEEYTSDSKLNPYTNTNKYLRIMMGRADILSKNNYTKDKSSTKISNSWEAGETTTFTLQYNNAGFPVQATGIGSDGKLSVQYHYEYITQ
jgi:hypothetical protein